VEPVAGVTAAGTVPRVDTSVGGMSMIDGCPGRAIIVGLIAIIAAAGVPA
jgi:hypothetical protein